MSHQFIKGFFSNNEPAWHGLGKVLPDGVWPGREEAMKLAGHDWSVIEEPVYAKGQELAGYKSLFDDKGNVLAVVSREYAVIQNSVPYDLIEAVAKEGIKWHCGMTLQRGQCVVVGYLPEEWTAPGDNSPTMPFLTATWAHDGVTAFKLLRSSIRVVCANTKAAAEGEAAKTGLNVTIRHTKNWQDYVERARITLRSLRDSFSEYKELATKMAGIAVSEAQVNTFLEKFLPMPETTEVQVSEIVKRNVTTARADVLAILNGANGTTPEAHRRTGYGLWQSGLEYLQHKRRSRTAYSKFGRSVLREEKVAENLHKLVMAVAE
jgi:phage/plasmid-like protein (TIGR03299 family)